jgi:pilus assembly protein Flp/PilA
MRKLLNTVQTFCNDEEGAALVEYAVLLGVLLTATITAITLLGSNILLKFNAANNAIGPAAP